MRTAERIRHQYASAPVAYRLPPPSQHAANHWQLNLPPTQDMALTLQRGQMISALAERCEEDPSYRHYYSISEKSLSEQFRHWVESQAFDKHLDNAGDELLWANSRLLARRGLAASRDLIANNGQPSQPVHTQLFDLYARVQYPCLHRIANQPKQDFSQAFNPMHHGWALRRTARDLNGIAATLTAGQADLCSIQTLGTPDAVAMLQDLFSWYYGNERQCLHTNLMPQRSWSRFCRKTDIVEGVSIDELYAAAKHLVEKSNIQHGVDFSDQQDLLLLRLALLQIAQWWLISEAGLAF